jgi:hypothetical protein
VILGSDTSLGWSDEAEKRISGVSLVPVALQYLCTDIDTALKLEHVKWVFVSTISSHLLHVVCMHALLILMLTILLATL